MANMVNLVNCLKFCKCAPKNTLVNVGTKTVKHAGVAKSTRLYSIRKDPVIGTEIRNNMTGTRYLQRTGVNSRVAEVEPLTTVHYADGRYSGIPNSQFNKLLKELQQNPDNWNPVIKSDAFIGKELFVNNPAIAGRYFRSAEPIDSQLIMKIANGRHHGMRLEEFDNMILNLLG